MKHLARWVWISSIVVFVGTMPHAVGASLNNAQPTREEFCLIITPSMAEMKKLAKVEGKKQAIKEFKSYSEWVALYKLWMRESKWDYLADNKYSTAFGIPQLLGMARDTSVKEQIELGIKYIKHRYGLPSQALAFHSVNGWY